MSKVMIDLQTLENFSEVLDDIQFRIKMRLGDSFGDAEIHDLMIDLMEAWLSVYNPIEVLMSRSKRQLYFQYIKAKKSGDLERANACYRNYRELSQKV